MPFGSVEDPKFNETIGNVAVEFASAIPITTPYVKAAKINYDMIYYFSIFGIVIAIILILLAFYTLSQSNYTGTTALMITGGVIGGMGIYFYRKTKSSFEEFTGKHIHTTIKKVEEEVTGDGEPKVDLEYFGRLMAEKHSIPIIIYNNSPPLVIGQGENIEMIESISGAYEDGCNCENDNYAYGGVYKDDLLDMTNYVENNDDIYLKKSYSSKKDNYQFNDEDLFQRMDFHQKQNKPKGRRRGKKHGGEEFEVEVEDVDEKHLLVDLDNLVDKLNIQIAGNTGNEILQNLLNQIDEVKLAMNKLNNDEKEDIKKILNKLESESKHVTDKIDLLKNEIL